MCQQSTGRCSYLGNTPLSLYSYVDDNIGCKYILGISQGCSLGSDLQFHAHASLSSEFCRPPPTYVHVSRAGLLPSTRRKERLALRNSYQDILNYLDLTCMYGAGLLACSPSGGGSRATYGRARRLLPPQVGVLGGVRPSAPGATPSSGNIPSGAFLNSSRDPSNWYGGSCIAPHAYRRRFTL